MKRSGKIIIAILLVVSIIVAGNEMRIAIRAINADYPTNDINGYVAWAAGGATDTISRTLSVYAGQEMGTNIIIQNITGATGAIATEQVHNQPSDGYSILFNAENPTLYGVMGISDLSYNDFYPVLVVGRQTAVIVVRPDSPYESITDLIADALSRPGEIGIGTTGVGGLPYNVCAMLYSTSGVEFNQVPFDGDSSVLTALLGQHIDVSVVNYSAASEMAESGLVKILSVIDNERLSAQSDVEAIGEVLPEYQKYFPWGAFVGVYVNKDCSDTVKETLSAAFLSAYNQEDFQTFLEENYITPMGLTGDEATEFIDRWQRTTVWLLEDAGLTEVSPVDLGIPRLEE